MVTNALRLNLFQMYDSGKDRKIKTHVSSEHIAAEGMTVENKEDKNMTKTMKIEGMMCGHCEARVKKCLEALPQVAEAAVSHEAGTAVVTLNGELSDDVLKKTVEDQDYKVISIE